MVVGKVDEKVCDLKGKARQVVNDIDTRNKRKF